MADSKELDSFIFAGQEADVASKSEHGVGREKISSISLDSELRLAWGGVISQKAGTVLAEFQAIEDAVVLLFVNRGKLSVRIDDNPLTALAGQALIVLPGEKCVGAEMHETDMLCHWLSFVVERPGRGGERGCIEVTRITDVVEPETAGELFRLLSEDFHKHQSIHSAGSPVSGQGTQLLLLSLLARLYNAEVKETPACNVLTVLAERARDYVRANSDKPLTIAHLAATLECSEGYLRTAFRHTYGYNPNKYLLNVRMNKARIALIHSRMTINEVAEACGYQSPSYFTRIFLREHGVTPSHYRIIHCRQYVTEGI